MNGFSGPQNAIGANFMCWKKVANIKPNHKFPEFKIKVTIIHKSDAFESLSSGKFWKVLMSDETGVIYAYVYYDHPGVLEKLVVNRTYIIFNPHVRLYNEEFGVEEHPHGSQLILRDERNISQSDTEITNLHKYIPFKFTELQDILKDDYLVHDSAIDLLGIIREIHWKEDNVGDWSSDLVKNRPAFREFELTDTVGRNGHTLRCTVWEDKGRLITGTGALVAIKGAKMAKSIGNRKRVNLGNTCEIYPIDLDADMWIIPEDMKTVYWSIYTTDENGSQEYEPPICKRIKSSSAESQSSLASTSDGTITGELPPSLELLGEYSNISGESSAELRKVYGSDRYKSYADFVRNETPMKVAVASADKFQDVTNKYREGVYSMRSNPRGLALIINNLYFNEREICERKGSFHDERYMEQLFKQMGFEIQKAVNLCLPDLPATLELFKKRLEIINGDACAIVVMSHGLHTLVELVDGNNINLWTDIVYKFKDELCPSLKGKPKLFVFQACQDFIKWEDGVTLSLSAKGGSGYHIMKDTIVCFPSLPGTGAVRDFYLGSYFIYWLAKVVMENAYKMDLIQMLHLCQDYMTNPEHTKLNEPPHQCFWITLGFRKLLFFNPGLYRNSQDPLED